MWHNPFVVATVFLGGFHFLFQQSGCKEWCKAKQEVGKPEFAECVGSGNEIAKYTIETVPLTSSGVNLFSNVSLVLSNGHGLRTKEISIGNETEGVLNKVFAVRNDIGNPEFVHLKLNSVHKNWKCKKITVWKDFRYWVFDCIDVLNDKKPEATYFLSGTKLYVAYVQTGKDPEAGTNSSVEIILLGNQKRSNTKVLHDGFKAGSLKKIKFQASDVGDLEDIVLTNKASNDPWYCDFIKIKSGRKIHVFNVKSWIGHPYEPSVKVNIRSDSVEGSAKDIDCHVRGSDLINVDTLPSTLSNKVHIFKVRCPQNCQASDFAQIEGSTVHPASTSICASAIHDGSLSPSGGEIIVTVASDLSNYHTTGEKFNGIEAIDFTAKADEKNFTFYTYHLDSIDDVKGSVRIVDSFGKLSSLGRLEIRTDNKWGAICKKGPNFSFTDDSAKRACRDLGFPNGIYIKENCGHVNGQNYCAGYGYPFSGAGVLCSGNETSLLKCNTDKATNCVDHTDDVIIQCLEHSSSHVVPDGTVRIVDVNGSPSTNGIGRLQIFHHNSFGSVCSEGWLKEAEHIACLEMGFKGMKGNGFSHRLCSDISGANLCGPDTEKINAVNVRCKGSERHIRDCEHDAHEDIYCSHDEDVVIGCEGEDGDASGIGLTGHKNLLKLEKRDFPHKIELTCFDKVVSKSEISNAHVGDVFLVSCPEKCDEETGTVKGTFVYTFDSPICKAAIHAGVLNSNAADDVVVVVGPKHKTFVGTKRNEVESHTFNGTSQSFQVSVPTTSLLNEEKRSSTKADKDELLGKDVAEEEVPSVFNKSGKVVRSFVQPNFQWIAPTGFVGFNGKENDFIDCSNLPNAKYIKGLSNFTFVVFFTVSGGDRTWRTLLSHSSCEGISISVDEENELLVEQNCNPKLLKTGFKPPMGTSHHFAVVFNKSTKTVVLYVNGRKSVISKSQHDFTLNGDLVIGRSSKSTTDFFIGNIHLVEVYKYALSEEEIKDSFNLVTSLEYININATTGGAKKQGGKRRTIDGRECVGPCKPKSVINKSLQSNTDVINLHCSDDLLSEQFNGKIGTQFLVTCVENCVKSSFSIKGNNNHYTPDSSICKAATHAGVFLPDKKTSDEQGTNTFIVKILDGLLEYKSSRGHYGIISKPEKQSQLRSFGVFSQTVEDILTCSSDAQFVSTLSIGESVTISCPSKCDETHDKVFGTNVYSPSSAICKAAIHSGVLSTAGGQVDVVVGPKQQSFKGSTQNKVESLDSSGSDHSVTFVRHIA